MNLEVYGYGSGEIDQLGLGEDVMMAKKPKKILPNEIFTNLKIVKIACGAMHTLALSSLGIVYSWGCNDDLALGRTGVDNVPGEVKLDVPVNGISAGDSHSVAYSTHVHKIYQWGSYRNTEGKFGTRRENPVLIQKRFWKGDLEKVVCGANHTLILSAKKVYAFGSYEFGQTGRSPLTKGIEKTCLNPTLIFANNVYDIFTGTNHAFLLCKPRKSGNKTCLKSWGLNNSYQLGYGKNENQFIPEEISFFNDKEVKQAVGGDYHSLVLLENGDVYVWGKNDENQLGIKDTEVYVATPTHLSYFGKNHKLSNIYASNNYSYAASFTEQKVYSWGFGENYILGNLKDDDNEKEPFEISKEFFNNSYIDQLSLGNQHVMVALTKSLPSNNINELPCLSERNYFEYDLSTYISAVAMRMVNKKKKYQEYVKNSKRENMDKVDPLPITSCESNNKTASKPKSSIEKSEERSEITIKSKVSKVSKVSNVTYKTKATKNSNVK